MQLHAMPLKVELVAEDSFKRCGVGSFAIHFAEEYIKNLVSHPF
jgi:hypothetical protein